MTPLDIVYQSTDYKLRLCHRFAQSDSGDLVSYPVGVYLREINYPYSQLTNMTTITVGDVEKCEILSLMTNYTVLRMDLTNHAALVFDVAPDMSILEGANLTQFNLYLSKMAMDTTRVPARTPTNNTIRNIIKREKNVTEGWIDKVNSANAGYGIVLALVICACIAFGILFFLTMRRINAARYKTQQLKKELISIEDQMKKAQDRQKSNEYMI